MEYDPNISNKFYQTSWPSLSVKLHATGATAYHGFVAEVLTLPISPHGLGKMPLLFSRFINITFRHLSRIPNPNKERND